MKVLEDECTIADRLWGQDFDEMGRRAAGQPRLSSSSNHELASSASYLVLLAVKESERDGRNGRLITAFRLRNFMGLSPDGFVMR